jgi:succinyl-CoA synthetase alpha subunit
MTARFRAYPNLYKDSVSLMTVSAEVMAVPGITAASIVMATAANVENLAAAGLGQFDVRPNDLIVAVAGADVACDAALAKADDLLKPAAKVGAQSAVAEAALNSIQMAVARHPGSNLALISVPGDYAAAEAMKALALGMDVMVFSDNVPVAAELAIKTFADARGLMVMGPDCGTAIVNGVPLGFANVVRRGPIGVVGASGTGTQEVTVRIHQAGSGVSHALGTGGHDLSEAIGGISMLHGLAALDQDPGTEVIVLISKPPSPRIAARVLGLAEQSAKPVVVIFLGADPATVNRPGVHAAATLAGAADLAVALLRGDQVPQGASAISDAQKAALHAIAAQLAPGQRHLRGVFCGGTFCFEAQLILAAAGHAGFSNAPITGNQTLPDKGQSIGHTILDMGDDAFTQGRPHPMIDPGLRDARILAEAADPSTAVVLFDVVLGYGATADPMSGLIAAITEAKGHGRSIAFIGHVCGTDQDPQDRAGIIAALQAAGVMIAGSNAEAALWSASILTAINGGAA